MDRKTAASGNEIERMVARLRQGDVRALARAISMVEDGAEGAETLLAECRRSRVKALKIGVTGPPGAGKSTLVDQMARWLRGRGEAVGVIAIDPSSPYTGGALLGDRIRMQEPVGDAGIYVRSMASRGAVGGVARAVRDVCDVMEASGRGKILIETVGVGQDEVEIARLADVTVLVLVPGMGDDVQSLKAGLMEIADVFVVNKSDREGAERVVAEIVGMQGLASVPGERVPAVVQTVATTGEGVEKLMDAIAESMDAIARCGEEKSTRDESHGAREWMSELGNELRLDHLGVAVKSIAGARGFYEMLGMAVAQEERVEHEQVKVAMLPMGESRLELLEPTAEDSVIGRFLAKRGEGLHHIAMKVADVDAMFVRLKENGVRLVSDQVRRGAGGHRYFFVHPASTGGVLLEIVGEG
ncbi:methylmalonyl Co-A mutase-associated GTPase MeaB [Edaphobacter modestus]|uniref:methylmalonyl Co-A mutase-associated GTPase MeaB n=1 Tax=Edaphobacter modestus TaxID=388466 RepID=UPI001F5EB7EE|nr:methylmalonyl Co-A mutase-associated GTPase MeaB [Edaphobacter modestus]